MTRRREEIINEFKIFFGLSYDKRNHNSPASWNDNIRKNLKLTRYEGTAMIQDGLLFGLFCGRGWISVFPKLKYYLQMLHHAADRHVTAISFARPQFHYTVPVNVTEEQLAKVICWASDMSLVQKVRLCSMYVCRILSENLVSLSFVTSTINPLQTKRRPLYLKTQSVPRCKHFSSRLQNPISLCCKWHKSLFVLKDEAQTALFKDPVRTAL